MPARLAPVAVAILFGLTGLQDPITRDPFGAATIAVDYGQLAAIWRDERAQLVADAEAVAACLADGVPDCAAAATPDGRTALSGSGDTTLKLWDLT